MDYQQKCGLKENKLIFKDTAVFVVFFILKTQAFIIHNKLKIHDIHNEEKTKTKININMPRS